MLGEEELDRTGVPAPTLSSQTMTAQNEKSPSISAEALECGR